MSKRALWLNVGLLVCLCLTAATVKAQADNALDVNGAAQPNAADAAKQLIDRDPLVRQHAAEELARLAEPDWRRLTEGYRMQEKNARVRLALDWALYRMGKADALYEVVRALDASHAAQAAGYLGVLEAPRPLYAVLPRVNGNTQVKLLEVFAHIGDSETLTQIKPFTASYDPKLAAAARRATDEITRRLAAQPAVAPTRPRQVSKPKPPAP